MTVGSFKLKLNANGTGQVIVGDVDLSSLARGIVLNARPGELPRLVVELLGEVDVEGFGDVSVTRRTDGLADFLANIDADELEREALSRLEGFDDRSVTQSILDVLAEWVKQ